MGLQQAHSVNGVARNFNWGPRLPSVPLPPSICLSLPFPFFTVPSLPLSFPFPLLFPPLEVKPPKIQLKGLGERCELPQRGLEQSPSRNQIWCILAFKNEIWWQRF